MSIPPPTDATTPEGSGEAAPRPLAVGDRVAIHQQIPQRDDTWSHRTEGVIERLEQRKTGSWFAHSKDDKLWLDRLVLRKDDGELVMCNLDQYSRIELVVDEADASAS